MQRQSVSSNIPRDVWKINEASRKLAKAICELGRAFPECSEVYGLVHRQYLSYGQTMRVLSIEEEELKLKLHMARAFIEQQITQDENA